MPNMSDGGVIIDVTAALVCRQRRFLASLRPPGKAFGGYWELPGGKREKGESIEAAMRRELLEELGIDALECELMETCLCAGARPGERVRIHFFRIKSFQGEPEGKEGQSLRWVSADEALSLGFIPADEEFLQRPDLCNASASE